MQNSLTSGILRKRAAICIAKFRVLDRNDGVDDCRSRTHRSRNAVRLRKWALFYLWFFVLGKSVRFSVFNASGSHSKVGFTQVRIGHEEHKETF
jgi:hypothetical protein